MDTNSLINHSRARFDHQAARLTLKEKYLAKMIFGYRGGLFRTTPEMISFLSLYSGQTIVILDLYENPIEVDALELLTQMKERFQEQMNAWLAEIREQDQTR
jgi:hypothetical protein